MAPGAIVELLNEESLDSQLVLDATANGLHGNLGTDAQIASDDPLRVPSVVPFAAALFADGFERTSASAWTKDAPLP